jgi:hypothetical protein
MGRLFTLEDEANESTKCNVLPSNCPQNKMPLEIQGHLKNLVVYNLVSVYLPVVKSTVIL